LLLTANVVPSSLILVTQMMEVLLFSETSAFFIVTALHRNCISRGYRTATHVPLLLSRSRDAAPYVRHVFLTLQSHAGSFIRVKMAPHIAARHLESYRYQIQLLYELFEEWQSLHVFKRFIEISTQDIAVTSSEICLYFVKLSYEL
jgi:hypothetical protein